MTDSRAFWRSRTLVNVSDNENGQPQLQSTAKRRRIPLAALVLGTMTFFAAAAAIPVSIVAYDTSWGTVSDTLAELRAAYVQQVQDAVTTSTSHIYETIQTNAENLSILDTIETFNGSVDFLSFPDMLYSYAKSIERCDFLWSAGFEMTGSLNSALTAKPELPGSVCRANATASNGRWCESVYVSDSVDKPTMALNITTATLRSAQPPMSSINGPSGAITGMWTPNISWTVVSVDPLAIIGSYRYSWNQWKGLPLARTPAAGPPMGSQIVQTSVSEFSKMLRNIDVPAKTGIAIWNSQSGELIATNGLEEIFNASSIRGTASTGYTVTAYPPDKYPNTYIAVPTP
ncbi:hypothetical protein HDU87_001907 [Geranomyces variabilis]|uniref:Uncharacterized protein n=1 Tax=Geranomyces variabilis TaxID=109894 RepID=A0AAD5XIV4_9FUNG|nr:hypothetical protein HDU87_001907 [Geranomyces variabilis]